MKTVESDATDQWEQLERSANLVEAAAREECAVLCDTFGLKDAADCAAAIRLMNVCTKLDK